MYLLNRRVRLIFSSRSFTHASYCLYRNSHNAPMSINDAPMSIRLLPPMSHNRRTVVLSQTKTGVFKHNLYPYRQLQVDSTAREEVPR